MRLTPETSVILCVYTAERLEDIHKAVDSLLSQTQPLHEIIIAVDHNEELYNQLQTQLSSKVTVALNKDLQGLSGTRNVGVSAATGELVAFLDDDAIAEKDWTHHLAKHFEDPNVIAIGGKILPMWLDKGRPYWFPEELYWIIGCTYKGMPTNGNEIRNVIGCNMAFRKKSLVNAGLFRSDLGRTGKISGQDEETELCIRIKSKMPSGSILYEPNAIVYHKVHPWRLNLKFLIQRSLNEGRCKSLVRDLSAKSIGKPLSSEYSYLRHLLLTAIPNKLRYFYRKGSLSQAAAILASIVAVGTGYLTAQVKIRKTLTSSSIVLTNKESI